MLPALPDHDAGTTSLVAQWPLGPQVPDPDPAVGAGSGWVSVPVRQNDATAGVLGLLNAGEHDWTSAELNALTAIASLMADRSPSCSWTVLDPPGDGPIGMAEATNLAGELGRWVIVEACHQLARWGASASERGLLVRVNVSPAYLISVDFVAAVDRALRASGVDGQALCLEITEHATVRDQNRALRTLAGLKELGAQIAIDDFGTGYSSLAQLKSLPVDALKIDRDFVRDLGDSEDDPAIVQSIVHLAEAFDLSLVPEGVRTSQAARTLLDLGCYRAQGFLIGRPRPPDELSDLIARGSVDLTPLGLTRHDVPGGLPHRALGWGS